MNKGVIYICTSNTSGKSYIGQASNYVSDKIPWGAKKRWISHVTEAMSSTKDHCRALNNAIRKYGSDDFLVITLGEFLLEKLDYWEEQYINAFNTLTPGGYNLSVGGSKGKDSDETRERKSKARLGKLFTDETRVNISKAQLGNRRGTKTRKYEEDKDLPKYIRAVRTNCDITGYTVVGFPIGITSKEYAPSKSFYNQKYTNEEKLEMAINHLNELKQKYAHVDKELEKFHKEREEELIKKKLENKKKKKTEELPEHVFPIYKHNRLIGYYVEGVKDLKGKEYPKQEFTERQSNFRNLNNAKRHIKLLNIQNNDSKLKIDVEDEKDIYLGGHNRTDDRDKNLPTYISSMSVNGKRIGYFINHFPMRDTTGNTIKTVQRKFCSTRETMEDKYKKAVDYLNELKKTGNYLNQDQLHQKKIIEVIKSLPKYMFPSYEGYVLKGYYVEYKNVKKEFSSYKTVNVNLNYAKQYLNQVIKL